MSSSSKRIDCLVVGNEWSGPWLAQMLQAVGMHAHCWILQAPREDGLLAAYIGTGETRRRTELAYGVGLTSNLWHLSEQGFHRLENYLHTHQLSFDSQGAVWFRDDESLKTPLENSLGLVVQRSVLASQLLQDLAPGTYEAIDTLVGIEQKSSFDYRILAMRQKQLIEMRAPAVFLANESLPRELLSGLASIWLPATLNRYVFPTRHRMERSISLFHEGLDFALQGDGKLTLGSFRNLYEDRGFGIKPSWEDPVSLKSVTKFFKALGWIEEQSSHTTEILVEAISCDGLPIVGSLSAYPGIFLIAGFAGRPANLLFEISARVAAAFAGATPDAQLEPLSPRRLG